MKLATTILTLIVLSHFGTAQSSDSTSIEYESSFWLDGGVGYNSLQIGTQVGLVIEVKNGFYVAYDYDIGTQVNRDFGIEWTDASSHAFSVGKLYKTKKSVAYAQIGISTISGTHGEQLNVTTQTLERFDYRNVGLRIEAGGYLSPNIAGLGASFYFNISSEVQYVGLTLNLALGQLNGRKK